MHKLLSALAALAVVSTVPAAAVAQRQQTPAYRPTRAQATADMRSRIAAAIDRVRVTEQHGKLTPARSVQLRRQLTQAQRELAALSRGHQAVAPSRLARYDGLIVRIDAELGADAGAHPYGNDALPSPEVIAFQHTDARLHYRDARIEHDANNCAVYQGTAFDGRTRREPLRGPDGRQICQRR